MATTSSNPFDISVAPGWVSNTPTFLPIIPGGAGWGMKQFAGSGRHQLIGGRARVRVVFVENLELSGTGSLRNAFQLGHSAEAKTIVPAISGRVDLGFQNQINVSAKNNGPYLTYAGQCAPDQGLFTTGSGLGIFVSDVLLWHYGHMAGKQVGTTVQDGELAVIATLDPGVPCDNVLLANCSGLYSRDGNCLIWPSTGTTQHNIGMWQTSWTDPLRDPWGEGPNKGRGTNWGGSSKNSDVERADTVSELRCFYAHISLRMPLHFVRHLDLHNNLYFHFNQGIQASSRGTRIKMNTRHNLFAPLGGEDAINRFDFNIEDYLPGSEYYIGDNNELEPIKQVQFGSGWGGSPNLKQVSSPIIAASAPGYESTPVGDALRFAKLLADHVGVKPNQRMSRIQDAIDQCLNRINDTGSGYGDFIDTEDDVGGLPTLTSSKIDHTAASAHGGDPIPQPDANATMYADGWMGDYDIMPSGYTRLEEWLHRRNGDVMPTGWDR